MTDTKQIVLSDIKWLDTPPFCAPQRPRWTVKAKNLYSEPVDFSIGLWWYSYWREGGWASFHLEGLEERVLQSASVIPAEQGLFGLGMNLQIRTPGWPTGFSYPDIGLPCQTIQRDSDLVPAGQPQKYPDWTGLKEFPVPASPYGSGMCIKAIRLPMLSRTKPTRGEMEVQFLSPKDHVLWKGGVCYWSLTESRCGLGIPNGVAAFYTYQIGVGLLNSVQNLLHGKDGLWGTDICLTDTGPSGLYKFDMNFKPSVFPVGSYPFAITMTVTIPEETPVSKNHPMFWGLKSANMLMFPTVGYINVGSGIVPPLPVPPVPPSPPIPPPPPFNPMSYDKNHDGIINKDEAILAIKDYFDGKITKDQVLQIVILYFGVKEVVKNVVLSE